METILGLLAGVAIVLARVVWELVRKRRNGDGGAWARSAMCTALDEIKAALHEQRGELRLIYDLVQAQTGKMALLEYRVAQVEKRWEHTA